MDHMDVELVISGKQLIRKHRSLQKKNPCNIKYKFKTLMQIKIISKTR